MSDYEKKALADMLDEAFHEDFNRWCGLMEAEYGEMDCPDF